jgi:hypothetical protein
MVVEFSNRLRGELVKLQESAINRRARAGTSDTGRMSMDSIRSLECEGSGIVEESSDSTRMIEAFSIQPT